MPITLRLVPPLALLLIAAPAAAQTARPVGEVAINMRDADIAAVAEQVSRITGRTLILDPAVRGTVNIISPEPLGREGVWQLFQSVLRANGFAAIRSGRAWRIVPQAAAIASGGGAERAGSGQELVTRLIRLRNLPSETAARVLRPLVASFGSLEALPEPNAIIVTDYADNVRRVERLAASLDGGGGAGFATIRLNNAGASEVAEAITRIVGEEARVAADERANVVLVRGDADALAQARRIATALDVPGGAAPATRVFRLKHSDAEEMTEILRGVLGAPAQATNPVAASLAGPEPNNAIGAGAVNRFEREPALPRALGGTPLAETREEPRRRAPITAATAASTGFSTDDVQIQSAPGLNAIVARGTPAALASMEALIAQLDIRRPQVLIEAAIVEITGEAADQLGIQLGFGAAAPASGVASATSFSGAGLPLARILSVLGLPASIGIVEGFNFAAGSRDEFGILVQALSTSTKANLLSTPSITTIDNQPAEIVVGQNVPFRTGSFTTEGNTTNPFTTIEREDVGLTLRVVPRIHQGDVIRLEVSQEVSSLVGSVAGAADLVTNRRSIQTTVLADDGGTIVLGGLITDDRVSTRSQVPLLGDIPVLGELFKTRRESQTRRTLFVFLRPTVLRDRAAIAAAAQDKYARLRAREADDRSRNLLFDPPPPRLPVEIEGIY